MYFSITGLVYVSLCRYRERRKTKQQGLVRTNVSGVVRTNLIKLSSELQLWRNCKNPILAVSGSLAVSIPVCQAGITSGANCLYFFVSSPLSQNTELGRAPLYNLPVCSG